MVSCAEALLGPLEARSQAEISHRFTSLFVNQESQRACIRLSRADRLNLKGRFVNLSGERLP